MHVGYLNNRMQLGFTCEKDIDAVRQLSNLTNTLKIPLIYISDKSNKIFIFTFSKNTIAAIFILLKCNSIGTSLNHRAFLSSEVHQSCLIKSDSPELLIGCSKIQDYLLKSRAGAYELIDDEQKKLAKSIVSKLPGNSHSEISINKLFGKILRAVDPLISNQKFWKVLAELEKPYNFNVIETTNKLTTANRPKGFEKITDDFDSRLTNQKVLNQRELKLFQLHNEHKRRVNRFSKMLHFLNHHRRENNDINLFKSRLPNKKTACVIKQEKINSNLNSLDRSELHTSTSLFGKRKTIIPVTPTSQETNIRPTSNLFGADSITGEIQDINIAFKQFKERFIKIGSNYSGKKQEYFFQQLNQCDIERFKSLSTEKDKITIHNVREAETMLQSEFEAIHEPNSITRMTKTELQQKNVLDGRFRKGLLSGQSNTLNGEYTDIDAKLLVSEKTLQHQANERKLLGHKNPNTMSMYQQGKNIGSSIVRQKHKHCNPDKIELPSSPDNVKHIINTLELLPSETEIAKSGVLDGARIAWADQLNVPQSSISDQTALKGITFLNEKYTIERVN